MSCDHFDFVHDVRLAINTLSIYILGRYARPPSRLPCAFLAFRQDLFARVVCRVLLPATQSGTTNFQSHFGQNPDFAFILVLKQESTQIQADTSLCQFFKTLFITNA